VIKNVTLPPDFAQYASQVEYIQQHSPTEWSSTCPSCKGDLHQDRSWPDRCRWFTSGKPVGWCRKCSSLFWPDKLEGYSPPSPQELEKWRLERVASEESRKRSAVRAIENLQASKIWLRYHAMLGKEGRAYWRARGVPDSLQDFWKLGFIDEHMITYKDESYLAQSATIPIFGANWEAANIKHRIINAPEGYGRYRYEQSGLPKPFFLTNPDGKLDGQVFAVEGEIKAMVTYATLGDDSVQMVGLPGVTPDAEAMALLDKAERVVLVLDPGADIRTAPDKPSPMERMAAIIGNKRCRVIMTPLKIDDGILEIKPTKRELWNLLKQAVAVGGM
jgi:hypothetical protein